MKKLITLVALSAITGVYGQLDRSVRPTPGAAPTINIKESVTFKTSNGITVVLSEDHKLPRVSISLSMGASPMIEGSKAGINNLMGSLIMSGTTKRTKDVLDQEVDYMGATLNADGNSVYLSCLTKHLDNAVQIIQDVVMNPTFPESEFDRIKKQNQSGLLSAKSDPGTMADNAENKVNFPKHPMGEVMDEASLAAITRADILENYKAVFTPEGSYMVIVGDITKEQAMKLADTYFAGWKGEKVFKQDYGFGAKPKGNRVIFVNKPGAVQSTITVTFPVDMKPGDKNQIPTTVLNGIFGGGGFGTRLMQNLREDKAYTYGCYSSLNVTLDGSSLSASGNFRNEVTDSAIAQILLEFNKITEEYVKDEELDLTKSTMAGNFARSLENPQTIARFALNIIRNNLPADYYKNYLKNLDAVSKDDILKMAQMYFANGYNIIVVGNESVLANIKQFDTDGVIEKLDAFGNEVKEIKSADISADDLINKYIYATTLTTSPKALAKKMKSLKSVVKSVELRSEQIPIPISMTEAFVAPNKEAMKIEAQGMVFQSSFYDGTKGAESNMQTGKKDLTAEELATKKKTEGFIAEMNYKKSGIAYSIKGIETINGKDYYVLESNDGETQRIDYFDNVTFMKYKTISVGKRDGESFESTVIYEDYKELNGFMFPYKLTQLIGGMNLSGTVKTIEVNGKVDMEMFK